MSNVVDMEQAKSDRMKPFRLGTLEVQGQRICLVADCSLTPASARTLAAQLLVLADQIQPTTKAE